MKALVSLSMALAVAVSAGAQTAAPDKPATVKIDLGSSSPTVGAKTDPKAAPKKDDKKKVEPPAKIDGVVVARGAGFLGVEIDGGHFKVSFYDAKKKPVSPDVTSAVLRWKVNYQPDLEHTMLTPGGGVNSLTSEKVIRQPYSFKLTLLLLKGEGDAASTETFLVDFQQ